MKPIVPLLLSCLLSLCAVSSTQSGEPARWYRGNTHTHTFWSDGNQLPELAADWYKNNGYDFLVLSDHNILSRGEKWKDVTKFEKQYRIFDQARERFGPNAVTSREENGQILVKLKTLEEIRKMVCEPGEFIMIEGDEITGSHHHRPAHANAINVDRCILPAEGKTLAEKLAAFATEVKEHGEKTGKPVFMHINHPNWKFSNTAEEVASARDANGVEIMNPNCNNAGDAVHPDTDRMWDIANTLRLKRDRLPPLLGCATDDTHNYHEKSDKRANPGRAWIMVRSKELTADAIVHAMRDGDFYASTGVFLTDVAFDAKTGTLSVKVDPETGAKYRIEFLGSSRDADLSATEVPSLVDDKGRKSPVTARYSDKIGAILKSVDETEASYTLTGKELYVRARVTNLSAKPHGWDLQPLQPRAWTQPVGWKGFLAVRDGTGTNGSLKGRHNRAQGKGGTNAALGSRPKRLAS